MMNTKQSIDVYIVMSKSGAIVMADDADNAADLAELEFDKSEDTRSVRLKIRMSTADGTQAPVEHEIELD
jgi:hypothetical protein